MGPQSKWGQASEGLICSKIVDAGRGVDRRAYNMHRSIGAKGDRRTQDLEVPIRSKAHSLQRKLRYFTITCIKQLIIFRSILRWVAKGGSQSMSLCQLGAWSFCFEQNGIRRIRNSVIETSCLGIIWLRGENNHHLHMGEEKRTLNQTSCACWRWA